MGFRVEYFHDREADANVGFRVEYSHDREADANVGFRVEYSHDREADANVGFRVEYSHDREADANVGFRVEYFHDRGYNCPGTLPRVPWLALRSFQPNMLPVGCSGDLLTNDLSGLPPWSVPDLSLSHISVTSP